MKFLFLILIGILMTASARAQSGYGARPGPKGEARVQFGDDREAELFMVEGPADSSDVIPFKVAANTCAPKIDQPGTAYSKGALNCRFEIPELMVGVAVIWIKHPDAKKIGKTVKSRDGQMEFRSFVNMRAIDYLLQPYLQSKEVRASQIGIEKRVLPRVVCSDYSWLPEPVKGAEIARWSLVVPMTNPETQQTEPRPLIDTFGVKLTPEGKKMTFSFLRQQRVQTNDYRFYSLNGTNSILPSLTYDGTPVQAHLSVQREDGESCDITLSSDKYSYNQINGRVKEPTGDVPEFFEGTKKPFVQSATPPELLESMNLFGQIMNELGPNGIE